MFILIAPFALLFVMSPHVDASEMVSAPQSQRRDWELAPCLLMGSSMPCWQPETGRVS